MIRGIFLCAVKPRVGLNIQVGQASSAAGINGQVSSNYAAAKKGQVTCSNNSKNGQVSSILAAAKLLLT